MSTTSGAPTDGAHPAAATDADRTAARPVRRHSPATDVALIATFAAFIAAGTLVSIPVPGLTVPITLQTFGVFLAASVLGARRGVLAVLLYLAVGTAGVPVFAQGAAGPGVWTGASVGYLVAFPLAALLAGFLVRRFALGVRPSWRAPAIFVACMATSLVTIHPLGITGLALHPVTQLDAIEAVVAGARFLPGDVLKNVAVAVVAVAVHRAFPALLPRR